MHIDAPYFRSKANFRNAYRRGHWPQMPRGQIMTVIDLISNTYCASHLSVQIRNWAHQGARKAQKLSEILGKVDQSFGLTSNWTQWTYEMARENQRKLWRCIGKPIIRKRITDRNTDLFQTGLTGRPCHKCIVHDMTLMKWPHRSRVSGGTGQLNLGRFQIDYR